MGFFDALALVEKEREAEIPNHLKDANRDKKGLGHDAGYLYPHTYQDHWVAQQYLVGLKEKPKGPKSIILTQQRFNVEF